MDTSAEDIEFFNLEPQDNYNGIENIKPLEIDGEKLYLDQNELTNSSIYKSEPENVSICCANEKNMALCDDAMSGNGKNVLLLDASCPRVYATNNIRDKANAIKKLYKKRGKPLIVITFSGRGIAVKFPNKEWDRHVCPNKEWEHEAWRKSLIGKLLEHIDATYGHI